MADKKSPAAKVITGLRQTEKAALAQNRENVYVFNVLPTATKQLVAKEIKAEHKVTPIKIRIVNFPKKAVVYRGKPGEKGGGKKAYVYLKKGDSIAA